MAFEFIKGIVSSGTPKTEVQPNVTRRVDNTETPVIDNKVNDYVLNGGKGLYCSQYSVSIDKEKAVGAYFTVINKGALSGDNYGGTYAGSGRGTYYDIESRNITL